MSMDVIFRVHEQEFISGVVDFKTFLSEAVGSRDRTFNIFGENGVRKADAGVASFAAFAETGKEEAKMVYDALDVNKLKSSRVHYDFHVAEPTASAILPTSWHKSLGYLKKEHKKKLNPQYKSVANRLLKYDRMQLSLLTMPTFEHLNDGTNARPSDEMVVACSIYYGYSRPLQYDERRLGRLMKVTDQLQLLGSSTLLNLKNAFECPCDISFTEDMSTTPPYPALLAKHRFPNSFFFIHDTCYVDDTVSPEAWMDLSEIVREWAKDKKYVGEMKLASMSQTRLIDLKARLGMPYLYVHQGQCEHLVCFTDLKLWETRDMPHSYYPIKMAEKNFRRVCCIGCKMTTAEWVVLDSDRIPMTPAFLCHNCYREFNFTKEGRKIGDFKAVPYCDRKAMGNGSTLFIQKLRDMCAEMEKNFPFYHFNAEMMEPIPLNPFPGQLMESIPLNPFPAEMMEQIPLNPFPAEMMEPLNPFPGQLMDQNPIPEENPLNDDNPLLEEDFLLNPDYDLMDL